MAQQITQIALVVRDYDEAIEFYTGKLGFLLLEDTPQDDSKRWVRVGPKGSAFSLLLAKTDSDEQAERVGNQAGGRVFLFLQTDDFRRDFNEMQTRGITFLEEPREEEYGTVAVFIDLYGNKWDLIEPKLLPS